MGVWGLGIGDWAQSPIPNPQSPIPNPHCKNSNYNEIRIYKNNLSKIKKIFKKKMSRKCNKISFGKINRYILLIVLGAILRPLLSFLKGQSQFFYNGRNEHPIVYNMTYSLGLCLNFILLIILKIRNKSAKKMYIEKENEKEKFNEKSTIKVLLLENDDQKSFTMNTYDKVHTIQTKQKNIKKYFWILLISFIDYIAYTFFCLFRINVDNYLNTWGVTIGFMSLFSYKILQIKLFRHHYLCIIIIIIEGISYNIIAHKFYKENITEYYPYYLSFLLTEILFSLVNVLDKYLIYKKYIKAYEILFFQGIIEFILGLITLIVTTKIDEVDNFFDFIRDLDGKEIGLFISFIVLHFLVYTIIITIVDIFSPFHVFLMNILKEFILSFFMDRRNESSIKLTILTLVCIIICLIMILIFIEIIELNFCGLSFMTKKNIELRANLDANVLTKDFKKINKSNELLPQENDSDSISSQSNESN